MFGFVGDYIKELGLTDTDYKIVLLGNQFVCVQGFKSVLKIESELIVLKTKNGELNIFGENLCIKELGSQEIKICGNILKIER